MTSYQSQTRKTQTKTTNHRSNDSNHIHILTLIEFSFSVFTAKAVVEAKERKALRAHTHTRGLWCVLLPLYNTHQMSAISKLYWSRFSGPQSNANWTILALFCPSQIKKSFALLIKLIKCGEDEEVALFCVCVVFNENESGFSCRRWQFCNHHHHHHGDSRQHTKNWLCYIQSVKVCVWAWLEQRMQWGVAYI